MENKDERMARHQIKKYVGDGHKFCAGCNTVKSTDDFYRSSNRRDDRDFYCRECRKSRMKKYRDFPDAEEERCKDRHSMYFPNRRLLPHVVSAWLHVSDKHPAEGYGRLGPFDRFQGWLVECFVDGQDGFVSEYDGVVAVFETVNDNRGRLTLHMEMVRMFSCYVERGKCAHPATGLGVFMPDFTMGMLEDLPDPSECLPRRGGRTGKYPRSQYIGVRQKSEDTFAAYYRHNDTILYLGTFETAVEAARAYDEQAKRDGKKTNF